MFSIGNLFLRPRGSRGGLGAQVLDDPAHFFDVQAPLLRLVVHRLDLLRGVLTTLHRPEPHDRLRRALAPRAPGRLHQRVVALAARGREL